MTASADARVVTRTRQKSRIVFALLTVAACAVAFAAIPTRRPSLPGELRTGAVPSLLVLERGGFRYEYHVASGREGLYESGRDDAGLENVIDAHAEVAAACRRALETRYGVADLGVLRARHSGMIRRLQALGYL